MSLDWRQEPDPVLDEPPRRHCDFDAGEVKNRCSEGTSGPHQPGHAAIQSVFGLGYHAGRDERLPVSHEVDHVGLLGILASLFEQPLFKID